MIATGTIAGLDDADRIFAALGDGTRRAIYKMVAEGPRTVSTLAQALGVSLTAVTQHLRVLQACGLVRTRKDGRSRVCEMDSQGLDVLAAWVRLNRQLWNDRFDALDAILREDPP